jgi:hypothetical protein
VVTGGETDELEAGDGEEAAEVAPTQTSTATRPRLTRRPHADCRIHPSVLLWSEDGSLASSSSRSSLTGISPQPNSGLGCSFRTGDTQIGAGHEEAKWVEGSIFDQRTD